MGSGRDAEKPVRVLLADTHALFREAVRLAIEGQPDLRVVGEARDGLEALAEADRTRPDVALLDADLPNCDGVRATGLIGERVPGCRVIVLGDEGDAETLLRAFLAGARGYVTKGSPLTELIEATHAVHDGGARVPDGMLAGFLDRLIARRREQDQALRRISRLTRRERQVLAILAEGGDNGVIAESLVISPQTARTHIQNVLSKLGVHSRLEAAALARQDGILHDLVEAER